MRKYSFILSILGILSLLSLILFLPPKHISSPNELPSLLPNQKIITEGQVIKQTPSSLHLSNSVILSCPSCPDYNSTRISAICKVNQYNNQTYLEVLRITTSS